MELKDFEALIPIGSKWVAKRPTTRALRDGVTVYTVVRQNGAMLELTHGAHSTWTSAVDFLDSHQRL
ncbi:MAG TPA: hypothetical protein VEY88_14265 [Archangium sp.]|nr:hypothetical protein [Archangium sp.]